MTAKELAEALEVSVRTVYRDMGSLSAAGIPFYAEPVHDGGYELLDGYRTRLTGLTVGEAESLFRTGLPDAVADLGLSAVVTAAQLKLTAALPVELRDRVGGISERFHLDAPSWYRDGDHTPHLGPVTCQTGGPAARHFRRPRSHLGPVTATDSGPMIPNPPVDRPM